MAKSTRAKSATNSSANFAWVQRIVHHLASSGLAGFMLANGSMLFNQLGDGEVRKLHVSAN